LLELVRPLMAGLDSTRDALQQKEGLHPERLMIATNLRVLVHEISHAMSLFRRGYPSIQLSVRYTGSEEIERLVLDSRADITLTLEPGPDRPPAPEILYQPAGELDYLLVTPPRHPLLRSRTLRLKSIIEYPLVLGDAEAYSRHRVQEVFHRHDLIRQMTVAVETSSDEYTLACVRAGLGVGIAVGRADSPLYQGLGVRSLGRWFGSARVGFMWSKGAYIPPLQLELAELLRSVFIAVESQ
jgi:DNA-binding transcriptional LysR family regulator